MRRAGGLFLAVLVVGVLMPATPVDACGGVPCGYVYPRLLLELGQRGVEQELTSGQPLHLEGNLTFTWDITSEGMAAPNPTQPIVVTFSFPRRAEWMEVQVEPAQIPIPIEPQYIVPTQTATGVVLVYRYTTDLAITATLVGQPTVDPTRPPTLLVLAQSSESLLFKPGFGVRNLPLRLPEAIVQTSSGASATGDLRIGEPENLDLGTLTVAFQDGSVSLSAAEAVQPWQPTTLTAKVDGATGPLAGIEMTATVVDEANTLLYTTGQRLPQDGTLSFPFTFPAPGQFRVLVATLPLPGVAAPGFDPFVAAFPITVPGLDWDALRYPDAYRATFVEPVNALHGNTQDLPRQWEQRLTFPVLAGADSATFQATLSTTGAGAVPAGSISVELKGPDAEDLAFGKLEALTPNVDLRARAPLTPGLYEVRLFGIGANPLGLAGSQVEATVGVFYAERPVGLVRDDGQADPLPGGAVPLGTGGMLADLVPETDPGLWRPFGGTLVVRDDAGAIALHPDTILTLYDPQGQVQYTTGHRHPHDGKLVWGFAFPSPGLYMLHAFVAPTAEVSGVFWQPAVASWPILLPVPADGLVRYPATYEAHYHDSTSSLTTDPGAGYSFLKTYGVPVKAGAQHLMVELGLMTMTPTQMVEGVAPADLTVDLLGPTGNVLASGRATVAGGVSVETTELAEPGNYTVRVSGVGYNPIDYTGAMYDLHIMAEYAEAPTEQLPAQGAPPPSSPPARGLPGFEAALAVGALALVMALTRRRRP